MGQQIKATYKEGEAYYQMSGAPHACVVTLLHYTGSPQNRPPARITVMDTDANGTFAHDIDAAFGTKCLPPNHTDPLFPHTTSRPVIIDQLV